MDHEKLIEKFYTSFKVRDGEGMAACYAPNIVFSDPVFPRLEGVRAGAMWKMLCGRAKDLDIQFENVKASGGKGSARWIAHYTFAKTGRKVVNVIDASFEFEGDLIVKHTDVFDFWRWSRQALGPVGLLLGWTSMIQKKVQSEGAKGLDLFLAK